MGFYDTFIPEQPAICPYCNEMQIKDFQTKALDPTMGRWRQGDVVQCEDIDLLVDTSVLCYNFCLNCVKMVYARAIIRDRVFQRLEIIPMV